MARGPAGHLLLPLHVVVAATTFTGSMAVTQAAQTGAFSGVDQYIGTMAVTQAAQTSTISGTNTPPTLTGSMAATQAAQTSSATALNYTGLWPTSVDGTNKRLLDQNGDPWIGVGDTSWSMVGQIGTSDITTYFDGIDAAGFNLTLFSAPEPYFTDNTPDYRNAAGDDPFTGTPFQSDINDAYWDVVDHAVESALARGITCLITPQYLGFNDTEGWRDTITTAYNANPTHLTTYGQQIAARYKRYPNIVWLIGHDDASLTTQTESASELIAAELASGTSHLITVGAARGAVGSATWSSTTVAYDFDTVYFDNATPGEDTATAFSSSTCIWVEGYYERERPSPIAIGAQTLREQMWEPILAGASGAIFGNNPRWHFESGKELYAFSGTWQNSLTNATYNKGTLHAGLISAFVAAVPAVASAVPDSAGTFLTSGTGFARFSTTVGVAYQTAAASITLDTTELSGTGNVRIRRYDPTDGSFTTVSASEAQNATRAISHPGNNANGDPDWVYVVDLTSDASGSMAVTQAAQASAISGTISFSGSMAVTQAAQTSAITGVESFTGTSATTQAAQTMSATGVESFTGTTATTQAAQTMSATGVSGSSPTGTMAVTEAAQTSTISGTLTVTFTATMAASQAAQTSSVTGTETFTGSSAVTQAAQTMSAAGIAGSNPTGVIAVTQAAQTSSMSGTVSITCTATMAVTQAAQTMTASGTGVPIVVSYGPALTYNPPPILTYNPPPIITGSPS